MRKMEKQSKNWPGVQYPLKCYSIVPVVSKKKNYTILFPNSQTILSIQLNEIPMLSYMIYSFVLSKSDILK